MAFKLEMMVLRSTAPKEFSAQNFGARDKEFVSGKGPIPKDTLRQIDVVLEEMDVERCAEMRKKDSSILSIVPRMPVTLIRAFKEADKIEAPPRINWGIEAVGADKSALTGEGVTVAVLDTGIDADHPAFAGVDLVQQNFTSEKPQDLDGHGTHCAGTIFGRDVDGCRIGVARGVKRALIGKVLGKGGGSSEQIVKAILWAQFMEADVISMSLGMDFPGYQKMLMKQHGLPAQQATSLALAGYRLNTRLFDQLSRAMSNNDGLLKGTVVAAAAGNESERPSYSIIVSPPAAGEMFVSVGALGLVSPGQYRIANFSNEGVTLAAPGEAIISARKGGGLTALSGTSMATPHVAGIAALWAEKLQKSGAEPSAGRVIELLKKNALDLGPAFRRDDVGTGLVQAP